jgi:hypothetical protein
MDDITQNGFDHHKFSVNTSIVILMPKKIGDEGYYNFILS